MSLSPPSASCSACMQQKKDNKTEREHEEVLSCHGHAILLITVQNNEDATRITVHAELNTFFSFHSGELFWKMTVQGF